LEKNFQAESIASHRTLSDKSIPTLSFSRFSSMRVGRLVTSMLPMFVTKCFHFASV
jgi:hypothetical protein